MEAVNSVGGIDALPLGAVIGTAVISECVPSEKIKCNDLGYYFGDFTANRYAWRMESPKLFKEPIPVDGKQGVWMWCE